MAEIQTAEQLAESLDSQKPAAVEKTLDVAASVAEGLEEKNDEAPAPESETKTEEKPETADGGEEKTEELTDLELEEEKPASITGEDDKFNPDEYKEIGVEIKSKAELKEYISSLKNERDTFRAKSEEVYANEKIRELNEFVKNGGDIERYTTDLQTVANYKNVIEQLKKVNPVEAYEISMLKKLGVNSAAELSDDDRVEFDLLMSSKSGLEKKMEGLNIINAEIAAYQGEVEKIETGITKAKENLDKKNAQYISKVTKAVQSLTGVDGIRVKEAEKQELLQYLKNPKEALAKAIPLDEDGLPDAGALVEFIYRHKYGKRNTEILLSKARSKGKQEVFEKLDNSATKEIRQHDQKIQELDDVAEAVRMF